MLRKHLAAFLVLLLGIGFLAADEVKGKFKKFAGEKKNKSLVVTVGDKDEEFSMGKGLKVYKGTEEVTEKKDRGKLLKGLKEGDEITVVFDKDGEKKVLKELKVK